MATSVVSPKGEIVIPPAVARVLDLTPGTRVQFHVDGKRVHIMPMFAKDSVRLEEIRAILKYSGPRVSIKAMRV